MMRHDQHPTSHLESRHSAGVECRSL